MKAVVSPAPVSGKLDAITSKSNLHRLMICAALGDKPAHIACSAISNDISATAACLNAMGADITVEQGEKSNLLHILPISRVNPTAVLDCGESGSTYRFFVPTAVAAGCAPEFHLHGRLPGRPMDELWSVLEAHGITVSGKGTAAVSLCGRLVPGKFEIAGNVSSQFITGLLFALPLLDGDSEIILTTATESLGYINMTLDALRLFSVTVIPTDNGYKVPGNQKYITPTELFAEGDWSNSAFWLCAAAAAGKGLTVNGLSTDSSQGDRAICDILRSFGAKLSFGNRSVTVEAGSKLRGTEIDAKDIPDLVPAIAVAATAAEGKTVINNIARLRLKESDRVATVCGTLNALGGNADADENSIVIIGTRLNGGTVDSCTDHRITMLAATLCVVCKNDITITGAEACRKSYPTFFDDFTALGGNAELFEEDLL
ncbi:MAG: 3-phosphoshikimate 1-carboxyvinyltransferase [Oscillospiraceae bacterium]|nr:3-phosphoshikimate 1-carboxyvinyltransferase [Oscillospiraceae bacterium]